MRIYYFGELIADTTLMSEVAGVAMATPIGDVLKGRDDYERYVSDTDEEATATSFVFRNDNGQCYA